jgi:uncharacterized protein YodC (DUF2158 family)
MKLIARAEDFNDPREPVLRIGDVVMANSGGPPMMVVDFDDKTVTCAWRMDDGSASEAAWPRPCVHRMRVV